MKRKWVTGKKCKNECKKHKSQAKPPNDTTPENLFDVLPFRDIDLSEEENKPFILMTYPPNGIYHQIKRACNKAGVNLVTKPDPKLRHLMF